MGLPGIMSKSTTPMRKNDAPNERFKNVNDQQVIEKYKSKIFKDQDEVEKLLI